MTSVFRNWYESANVRERFLFLVVGVVGLVAVGLLVMWWTRGLPVPVLLLGTVGYVLLRDAGPMRRTDEVWLRVLILLAFTFFVGPFLVVPLRWAGIVVVAFVLFVVMRVPKQRGLAS